MFLKYIPIFLFHLLLDIPGFPTKIVCVFLSLPMRATCPAHMVYHHGVAMFFALMEYYATYVGMFYFPLSLDNDRSPHGYINQRLQIQFRAPDDERYAARNMLSLQ
jgi:hypothetical protein